ncbi:uncharacterized protein MKZ38_008791 [Zalerion maritima]|uniref:NADP-dependent oxidoreductase domain-containing protein n=1 Tax=Zalerion maritima TaxID=339359 RepID=A0AAD5RVQ2_9PEZI|nr:uncharacterized protein MKZ38_008791 [Zalerion maritima]
MPQIQGKEVGPIGLGLMGLTWRHEVLSDDRCFSAMKASLANGSDFWNGGEFYGTPARNSLTLLNKYFTAHPEDASKVVLSIKGGLDTTTLAPTGTRENVTRSIENCVRMLGGVKKMDMFQCARVDKNVPLEETLLALKAHVDKGDIGGISLSEVSAKTIHDAVKIVKVDAVEVELSIWAPDVLENGVAKACAEHGIPLIAYSPLGRGVLTGAIKSIADIPEGDFRRHLPRFQPGAFEQNLKLVAAVEGMAKKKGCTPGQLATGWAIGLGKKPGMPVIIPIPGATTEGRVNENCTQVELTDAEMGEIQTLMSQFEITGGRYPDGHPIEG